MPANMIVIPKIVYGSPALKNTPKFLLASFFHIILPLRKLGMLHESSGFRLNGTAFAALIFQREKKHGPDDQGHVVIIDNLNMRFASP